MIGAEHDQESNRPLNIAFHPTVHPLLPVEVVARADIRQRVSASELGSRQRTSFHQLIVCYEGEGVHHVDFEPIKVQPGMLLHVHPGQVQQFQFEPEFEAHLVLYRSDLHHTLIPGQEWFPGSDVPTVWNLQPQDSDVARATIQQLRDEQEPSTGPATLRSDKPQSR